MITAILNSFKFDLKVTSNDTPTSNWNT